MAESDAHIPHSLQHGVSVVVETRYGAVRGGRTTNGAAVFLEVPYALRPERFTDPQPLPEDYRYEDKDYIYETKYGYQVSVSSGLFGVSPEDMLGLGDPSEDPLFVNIASPSSFTRDSKFPVRVYIHGGSLQFGSPHELNSQAQYAAQERSEVYVNIGYRLSVFGFLACDEPKIDGNFGFKDQWLALQWLQENIEAFGGNPANIRLSGLSAGAHSVHQILHHISHLPEGQKSPIKSAILQSNAILATPKTAGELHPQYEAICHVLGLDPASPTTLATLRDPSLVPPARLLHSIGKVRKEHRTFRGCLDSTWLPMNPDPMTWQCTGQLAWKLREKGMTSIVVGDLSEEWYLYGMMHPIRGRNDVLQNMPGYYPRAIVERLVEQHRTLPEDVGAQEVMKWAGEVFSDAQVHLPVRLLVRDLYEAGFPVLKYEIRWTPDQVRLEGFVTHGTDRCIWTLRAPVLTASQKNVVVAWLGAIDKEVEALECEGKPTRPLKQTLTLTEDQTIVWQEDRRWDRLMDIIEFLPGKGL